MTAVADYITRIRITAVRLQALSRDRPDLRIVRNDVGNAALVDGDKFVGWIEATTGELVIEE